MSENTQVRRALWDEYFRADTGTLDGDRMIADIATLTAENARLREDGERLDWMAEDPPFDGMGDIDLHELWHQVATKNGREEASVEDQREAFRLLLDTARAQVRP